MALARVSAVVVAVIGATGTVLGAWVQGQIQGPQSHNCRSRNRAVTAKQPHCRDSLKRSLSDKP